MKKLKVITAMILGILVMAAITGCSGKTTSENSVSGAEEQVSEEEVYGKYIDLKTGNFLEVTDVQCVMRSACGFWKQELEAYSNSKIKGKECVAGDPVGNLSISKSEGVITLTNDNFTFVPEEIYCSFEKSDVNSIGDAVATKSATLTLTDANVTTTVCVPENVVQVPGEKTSEGYAYTAPENKCYVELNFDYLNEDTNACELGEMLAVSVIYDNKYCFKSYETEGNLLAVDNKHTLYTMAGSAYGMNEAVSPLVTTSNMVGILCPNAIMDNPDKPLYAVFSFIRTEYTGLETVVYDLRSGKGNGNSSGAIEEEGALDPAIENALAELLSPISFGDSMEAVQDRIKENPNGLDVSDFAVALGKDAKLQGYSEMLYMYEFTKAPLKDIIDDIASAYVLFYFEDDEGGLVDVEYSILPNKAQSDLLFNNLLSEIVGIMTAAYGDPVTGEDMRNRSGEVGLAYSRHLVEYGNDNEGYKYWEWMVPEDNMKIELCYDSKNLVAWIDFRCQ